MSPDADAAAAAAAGGEGAAAAGVGTAGEGRGVIRWDQILPRRSLRVLLVEHDDSTRQVVTALLRKCGYRGEYPSLSPYLNPNRSPLLAIDCY